MSNNYAKLYMCMYLYTYWRLETSISLNYFRNMVWVDFVLFNNRIFLVNKNVNSTILEEASFHVGKRKSLQKIVLGCNNFIAGEYVCL